MKVLFVNKVLDRDSVGRVPLGCLYLSSALKRCGHEVKLVDACHYGRIRNCVKKYGPEVLLFSARTGLHQSYINLNKKLKQEFSGLYSIFGGPHPTFFPEIINQDGIDAICRGEGEIALVDFLNRKEQQKKYREASNFWVKENGEIYKNDVLPLIDDINAIAFPDRELVRGYHSVRNFGIRNFIASRGCPYSCSYCFNEPYFSIYKNKGKRIRIRSADNLIEEIEKEKINHSFEIAQFEDDIFGFSMEWLNEFRLKYKRKIGLPFICNLRPELISEELVHLLKEAGCVSIWTGIEAKNERVRKKILNRGISDKQLEEKVGILSRFGIHYVFEIMVGLPTSNINHDLESLDFCIQWKPTYVDSSIFQPFPGTRLTEIAVENKEWSGDYEKIRDWDETTPLNLKSKKDIETLQPLFYIIVEYPFLRKFIFLLLKLPLKGIYNFILLILKGLVFSKKLTPIRKNKYFFLYLYRIFFRGRTQRL